MKKPKSLARTGTFTLPPSGGAEVFGELSLRRGTTLLTLTDRDKFDLSKTAYPVINGVLHDGTHVSLVNCVLLYANGASGYGSRRFSSAQLLTHLVVYGHQHVDPDLAEILSVEVEIDDAATLFYDFDAFGTALDSAAFIDPILQSNRASLEKYSGQPFDRAIATGDAAHVAYFTGKLEIFRAETGLGDLSAQHRPTFTAGGPNGVTIRNLIVIVIRFQEAIALEEVTRRVLTLLRYFGVLIGRQQNMKSLGLSVAGDPSTNRLNVYWPTAPKRKRSLQQKPHPAEVLLDPIRDAEAFASVGHEVSSRRRRTVFSRRLSARAGRLWHWRSAAP